MKMPFASIFVGCVLGAAFALLAADSPAQVAAAPGPGGAAPGVPAAPRTLPPAPPPVRWTLVQLQEAFTTADSDSNNELTRAEAQQLVILPRNFEDLDANKDGVLSRAEYESIARQ